MRGEVLHFPSKLNDVTYNFDSVIAHIDRIASILRAIDAGQMLLAMPECSVARQDHNAALVLLRLAEEELHLVRAEIRPSGE